MKWLTECSAAALHDALRVVAPDLSEYPVTVPGPAGKQDPQWHSGSVPVGERFFVKFAWSRPAALQLAHEIGVLAALARQPAVPFLPEVIAASTGSGRGSGQISAGPSCVGATGPTPCS